MLDVVLFLLGLNADGEPPSNALTLNDQPLTLNGQYLTLGA